MDPVDVASMRRAYGESEPAGDLVAELVAADPMEQFDRWLTEAVAAGLTEPNAMVLATASADGRPSARTVLLKGYDTQGLVFYTNYGSRKGVELAANPRASAVFPWFTMHRQVVVVGDVTTVDAERSAAYFHSRPRDSQLSAAVSPQSRVIPDRAWLEAEWERLAAAHPEPNDVPAPPDWGGFLLSPVSVEFWQGRPNRLHDRLRYRRDDADETGWVIERLAP